MIQFNEKRGNILNGWNGKTKYTSLHVQSVYIFLRLTKLEPV